MTRKWIPCSEKTPKPYHKVLITTSWGGIEIGWINDLHHWESDWYNYGDNGVLAWRPLPKPYKEEITDAEIH